mmetsp:Transcript_88001/g.138967  ORF Transcript_88001/g.138967 Transcript_88001/m.138967 type:complete len:84 (-) Transcript_88001:1839-2090(-)
MLNTSKTIRLKMARVPGLMKYLWYYEANPSISFFIALAQLRLIYREEVGFWFFLFGLLLRGAVSSPSTTQIEPLVEFLLPLPG